MRYLQMTVFAVVIAAVLTVSGLIPVRAVETDAQRAKDRAEIEALMWRYVRALDNRDPEAYASNYTPDGEFSAGPNAVKGAAALKKMVSDFRTNAEDREKAGKPSPPMYHVITNDYLEFTGPNEARYHSYWMTIFGPAAKGDKATIEAVGHGIDQLVKVNSKWLIRSRNVNPGGVD